MNIIYVKLHLWFLKIYKTYLFKMKAYIEVVGRCRLLLKNIH